MKVACLTGLRQLELREEPEPKIERPDEALLRINRVGVCGSDVHYYTNGRIGRQVVTYPATVGHECAGTVVEVSSAVEKLVPGDRVAVDPAIVCGADWTGSPKREDIVAEITGHDPRGLDLVFECSGDPECIDQGLRLLTPGGALVLVGIPPTPQVSFDIYTTRTREVMLLNVRRQKGCIAEVIRMIADGRIDPARLLTHRFPLAEIRDAFELVATYGDGVLKAVVEVSSEQ